MRKKGVEKRLEHNKDILIVVMAIFGISLGIFMFHEISITGFAVIEKESTHTDNLNLVVNESQNITWEVDNPGVLQSLKASGKVSRNGSARVFVEKDGERQLIFDSSQALFDVNVEVLPDYKDIFLGDELLIQIILFNLRGFGKVDANVMYSIKDQKGNPIAAEEEIVPVETQSKFVRKLLIPTDIKPGLYTAFVEVSAEKGLIGTSSDTFEVSLRFESTGLGIKFYVVSFAAVLAAFIILVFAMSTYRRLKRKEAVTEYKEKMPQRKMQSLEKELQALKNAYESKLISKESYTQNKKRIDLKLKN